MSGPSEKASRSQAPTMQDGRPSGTGMENEQVVIETEQGAPAKVGWRQKGPKDPCCCGQTKRFCCIFLIICGVGTGITIAIVIILIVVLVVMADTAKGVVKPNGNTGDLTG